MSAPHCPRKSWSAAVGRTPLLMSLSQEELPVADAVRVSDESARRHFRNGPRRFEQLQTGFVRQAAAFLRVNLLAGPHAVFPRIASATGTRHNVVDTALFRAQQRAGILAAVAVAFAKGARAELGAFLWKAREVRQHDHRRDANLSAHGMHDLVLHA